MWEVKGSIALPENKYTRFFGDVCRIPSLGYHKHKEV